MRLISNIFFISLVLMNSLASSASITMLDDDGNFFEDQTPAAPIDGNPGVTVGEQRINAALFVKDFIESILSINAPVTVKFVLDNTQNSSILASARPLYFYNQSFVSSLPLSLPFYPSALANQYAGYDINSSTDDIRIRVGNRQDYYYGFSKPPAGTFHFISLIIHEMIHGLGMIDNLSSYGGTNPPFIYEGIYSSSPSIWDFWIDDPSFYLPHGMWTLYTPIDMLYATLNPNFTGIYFSGPATKDKIQSIKASSTTQTDYTNQNQIKVELFGTGDNSTLYINGHYNEDLQHNHEVMEPQDDPYDPYNHIGLAKYSLKDLGWLNFAGGDAPVISRIPNSVDIFINSTSSQNITKFAVWDNDNEMHLVNDYNYPESTNPWHPSLYVAVNATSSNQAILSDDNIEIWCSNIAWGSYNSSCEVFDLNISAGAGSPGSTTITINSFDSDSNTVSRSFVLNIATNTSPTVEINSPSSGHVFLTQLQTFTGEATDLEDGIFNFIDWGIKTGDGPFQFTRNFNDEYETNLTDGNYIVIACITDSDNNSACSNTIDITVSANQDFDNDGLSNSYELANGLNPYNNDSDNDGLLDGDDPEPLVPEAEDFNIPATGGIGLLALGLSMLGLGAVRSRMRH